MKRNLTTARKLLRTNRLFSYEVADKLGLEPSNFSRWFRSETAMTDERLAAIRAAVDELTGGDAHDSK